eukprot:NODE_2526_length_466_cov_503.812950_g2085_i0.p1 GENE.NODE_2526_length_466_cov_503.812950_g2085_i0~~NODE_2526_length_466_cov_503.812950_g2085_i0.p1  ORF type:complete len:119 (+),score=30.33 NODE_2526_length_466_cov_503.812950_g2085_i0:30-359(+)
MGPETGVYVHGLFLEGARWDMTEQCLVESKKGMLYHKMPVIYLEPVLRTQPDPENSYICPVYKTSTRAGALSTTGLSTNFVLNMQLPSGKDTSEHWILRGTAMLMALND